MLWLGRWRLALLYAVLIMAGLGMQLWLALHTNWLIAMTAGLPTSVVSKIPIVAVSIAALFHMNKLNSAKALRPWYSRWYVALAMPVAIVFTVTYGITTLAYRAFKSPSEDNVPNLMKGDYFIVSNLAYASSDPERGDIAAYKLPTDPSTFYLKRVIGLPGDKVQMQNGIVILNGSPLRQEEESLAPELLVGEISELKFAREFMPDGTSYVVANTTDAGESDNTDVYTVPAGEYFVLGDNRDNSLDSRYQDPHGYVPRDNFVGRLVQRVWNTEGLSLAVRPADSAAN